MNSPKLTNALLIVLIAINALFLIGWKVTTMRHRHEQRIAMYSQFHGMHHNGFFGHRRFGMVNNSGRESCCCGHRNYNNNGWN